MIIVTGASGLIGNVLTKRLSSNKSEFITISRRECNLTEMDLYDYITSLTSSTPSTIIHLAANLPFGKNVTNGLKEYEENKTIDLNVCNASEAWNAKVIYASTLSLYNKFNPPPYSECSELAEFDDNSYLKAKLIGESIFLRNSKNVVLRLPALIGQGLPRETVAGLFLEKAARNEIIEIWGTGLREQNYVDVEDIALAFIKVLHSESQGIFNIASPEPTTMRDLAFLIVKIFQKGKVVFSDKSDSMEYQKALYSCEKASINFGWKHSISLEISLRSLISKYENK